MNLKFISPGAIPYKLPFVKKTIEVPKKCINKMNALLCVSAVETFGGLGFTAAGIGQREPVFLGTGLAILAKVAGQIAMMKGSLWDFAGRFNNKEIGKILSNIANLRKTEKLSKVQLEELKQLEKSYKKRLIKQA